MTKYFQFKNFNKPNDKLDIIVYNIPFFYEYKEIMCVNEQ